MREVERWSSACCIDTLNELADLIDAHDPEHSKNLQMKWTLFARLRTTLQRNNSVVQDQEGRVGMVQAGKKNVSLPFYIYEKPVFGTLSVQIHGSIECTVKLRNQTPQ
jgi:hypothetical protein